MPADGYAYLSDELHTHRQHLDGIADALAATRTSAAGAGAPPNAFGLIGSFIPGLLQPLVERASQVIYAGAESVSQTGRMMQRTLEDYDQAESGAAAGFRGLEEQL